jgi:hypothetical protein
VRRVRYLATKGQPADTINNKNDQIHDVIESLKVLDSQPVKKQGQATFINPQKLIERLDAMEPIQEEESTTFITANAE